MSRLISGMQFFLSELHAKNYRFQPCAFLKFRKISEITSAVEILFCRRGAGRFAFRIPTLSSFVENFQECLQMFLKRTPLLMFLKVAGKFPKKLEQLTKIQRFSIKVFMSMLRLPNGRSFYFNEELL